MLGTFLDSPVHGHLKDRHSSPFILEGDTLHFFGTWDLEVVEKYFPLLEKQLQSYTRGFLQVDFSRLEKMDSAGIAAFRVLEQLLRRKKIRTQLVAVPETMAGVFQNLATSAGDKVLAQSSKTFLERWGGALYDFWQGHVLAILILLVDLIYYGVVDIFRKKTHRKGEFINQAHTIGVSAVPIVAMVAFLIGVVLALQSGEQLRQFGANVFIVDLIVVAMVQEMGPLITAIMIAGRSGSSIAAEVATMVVTEEVDALKTMGIHPLRFIVVPKLHAALFTLPFLTILADAFGIFGGMLIAALNMDVSPQIFYNRMINVLYLRDVVTGFVKSVTFAGLIVMVGSYFGFRARGGAESVGKVTTLAVVVSIILVIVADSVLGLIFY